MLTPRLRRPPQESEEVVHDLTIDRINDLVVFTIKPFSMGVTNKECFNLLPRHLMTITTLTLKMLHDEPGSDVVGTAI